MRLRRPDLPIPDALDLAVMKCLKKRMNERPRSAGELEQLLSAVPLEGVPTSYPPGTSRRAPSAAAAKKPAPAPAAANDPDAHTVPGLASAPPAVRKE
jgi:serine/threonine-protein kinase